MDVHKTRYNAMEVKQRQEALKISSVTKPPASKSEEKNLDSNCKSSIAADYSPILLKDQAPTVQEVAGNSVHNPKVSCLQENETSTVTKDELIAESDPVKLERKRRQQQKKEEFLQQLKRRRSDDNIPSHINIKTEATSPIPEGLNMKQFYL